MTTGRYIVLEGSEGTGKSTHAARLAAHINAVLTRETGGTDIGARIRVILHDTAMTHLSYRAEALLIAADRAQHIDEVVAPALAAGRHVVSDRSVYSTLAYQGYGRCLPIDEIRKINDWALNSLWPDLVILIDTPIELLERRMRNRDLDRFEREDDVFHARVRDGFRSMAANDPQHWIVIDGAASMEEVGNNIRRCVAERLHL
ncbi:MAG: dTMP kinase [Ilumatobacteraceae bacterium]